MAPKWLIVVGGATATGKTALAIELAKAYGTAVVSADSRQVFTELDIGAAKATSEELAMVPHFLINHLSVSQDYSVGDYERDALACLNAIFRERDIAILAGGSGLYIKAVCDGLDSFPEVSDEVRQQVESGEQNGGLAWLQYQLQEADPGYYETVDRNNPARLRRALEVCLQTGKPYSSYRTGARAERPFKILYILLDMPREQLYRRINERVDQMIKDGLEAEARSVMLYRDKPALQTVGYQEFFDYFDGKLTFDEAVDKIRQHTRNYAKRQSTWFRKYGSWRMFSPGNTESVLNYIAEETGIKTT